MTLSALLVCVDGAAARVLHEVLEELGIRVESCPDFPRAGIRLAQDRFDVVILDGESNKEVISLLRETRVSRLNDATLAIAVVSGQENIREMFSLGVNFVLYKPVAYDRVRSSLRAARAAMRKEKRRNVRTSVHAQATVDYANVEQEKATLVNLAHNGMAVSFGRKLPPTSKVYFQFRLPDQNANIRLSGQLIWQDWNGRAGVQFVDVPKASRRLLDEFLGANLPKETQQDQFSDVTVEMEEPVPVATLAGHEQGHGNEPIHHATGKAAVPQAKAASLHGEASAPALAQSGTSVDEAENRRVQTRYACRLGAEVFRTGIAVPHHCCLTDLSSGGCYLEVPLPFPSGSSVEIVVRTYEMKLRLRGTVQASHPGYGMGVAFALSTKEERDSVKKLTEFVAAAIEPSK